VAMNEGADTHGWNVPEPGTLLLSLPGPACHAIPEKLFRSKGRGEHYRLNHLP